jgi:hypothetical protein
MKGLEAVPCVTELRQAFDRLQSARALLSIPQIALYSQWARLDPRLAEILVGHFTKYWREIAPGALIQSLSQYPWPRSIAVLLRFTALALKASDRETTRHLIGAIEAAFPAPSWQLYFIPLQVPNSVILRDEVKYRTEPYMQSGYIGAQSLLSQAKSPANRTIMPADQRKQLLIDLLRKQNSVTVFDYIQACKGMVSRRQAQRDLTSFTGTVARGFTRSRAYHR